MEFTVGGQLEVRITTADVGKRVSVRRSTGAEHPGERFTDTVGVLTSWDKGVLRITRRSGEIVHIAESDLVAGKVVPSAPGRGARRGVPAASAAELTRVAARAWPAVEREPLTPDAPDGWLLRAAAGRAEGPGGGPQGFTRRANSVLVRGEPGLPLDEALLRVTAWYTERGLPPYVQLSTGAEGTQEQLADELDRRGWRREVSAHVLVGALAPLADRDPGPARVRLSRDVDEGWMTRYRRSAGPTPEADAVLRGGPSVWFADCPAPAPADRDAADAPQPPAAIGRLVVDGRWAGFTAVEVAPELRRQGLASAVMTALARQALDEGASAAYLQVETDNAAALALYEDLGFVVHHTYHHWRAPEEDAL